MPKGPRFNRDGVVLQSARQSAMRLFSVQNSPASKYALILAALLPILAGLAGFGQNNAAIAQDFKESGEEKAPESKPRTTKYAPEAVKHYNRGLELHQSGFLNKAVEEYKAAIKVDDRLEQAYSNLGLIYIAQKNFPRAHEAFDRALALKPNRPTSLNGLASVLYAEKQVEPAVEKWRKVVSIDPNFASAYYNMGTALESEKHYDEAIKAYVQAVTKAPDMSDAYYRIGALMVVQKHPAQAMALLDRAVQLSPDSEFARDARKQMTGLKDRFDKESPTLPDPATLKKVLRRDTYGNLRRVPAPIEPKEGEEQVVRKPARRSESKMEQKEEVKVEPKAEARVETPTPAAVAPPVVVPEKVPVVHKLLPTKQTEPPQQPVQQTVQQKAQQAIQQAPAVKAVQPIIQKPVQATQAPVQTTQSPVQAPKASTAQTPAPQMSSDSPNAVDIAGKDPFDLGEGRQTKTETSAPAEAAGATAPSGATGIFGTPLADTMNNIKKDAAKKRKSSHSSKRKHGSTTGAEKTESKSGDTTSSDLTGAAANPGAEPTQTMPNAQDSDLQAKPEQ
jgi:tetratricopeptide (TPR) repeat protein